MKCRMLIPLVCCSLLVGACAPVATYPARGDNAVSNDPNVAPMPAVVAAALSRAVRLYPVDGQYIINLPEGQSLKTAQRIHRDIGDEDGFLISSNAMKYPVIFEANKPMLSDPDKIYPGQVLRIPALDD